MATAVGVPAQLKESLPSALQEGRALRPGPVTGTVECLMLSLQEKGNSASPDHVVRAGIDFGDNDSGFSVLAVGWHVRSVTSTPLIKVVASDDADATTSTDILAAVDLSVTATGLTRSGSLASYDYTDGSKRYLNIMTHIGVPEEAADLHVLVWYYRTGHINADPGDD